MLNRRTVLKYAAASAAVPLVGTSFPSYAADFDLKWGLAYATTDPIVVYAKKAAEAIAAKTDGKVRIQVFPDGQLGGEADLLSQCRSGAIQLYTPSNLTIGPLVPEAEAIGLSFTLKTPADFELLSSSPVLETIDKRFQAAGIKSVSDLWTAGIRHITTTAKPVETPQDLQGLKIRVPPSPLMVAMFEMLGASPVTIAVGELYMSLQTKLVDAQENSLVVTHTRKFAEVQKYCALTSHIFGASFQVMNLAFWERLPADIQAIVVQEMNAAGASQRKEAATIDEGLQQQLTAAGMVFNTPDQAAFQKILVEKGYYSVAKERVGAEVFAQLEALIGPLT